MKNFLDKFKKNRNLSIAVGALVIFVVLAGLFFVIKRSLNNSASTQVNSTPSPTQETIQSINPADLGITLTAGAGNKTAILTVAKTGEIISLDYELSYMATVNGAQVSRGAIGHIDIKQKGRPVTQEITLGTCSDVCHYDVGISNIKLTLKINKTDGKTYQSTLTLSI